MILCNHVAFNSIVYEFYKHFVARSTFRLLGVFWSLLHTDQKKKNEFYSLSNAKNISFNCSSTFKKKIITVLKQSYKVNGRARSESFFQ